MLARNLFGITPPVLTFDGAASAPDQSIGTFSGGDDLPAGFKSGIILSTGDALFANNWAHTQRPQANLRQVPSSSGDADLSRLAGGAATYDSATLTYQFKVRADNTNLVIRLALVSEENAARAASGFNDVFVLYIDGEQIATLRSSQTDIPQDNKASKKSAIKRRGLRTIIQAKVLSLSPQTVHSLRIAIADCGDPTGDSVALVKIEGLDDHPPLFPKYSASTPIPQPPHVDPRENPTHVPETGPAAFLLCFGLAVLFLAKRFALLQTAQQHSVTAKGGTPARN